MKQLPACLLLALLALTLTACGPARQTDALPAPAAEATADETTLDEAGLAEHTVELVTTTEEATTTEPETTTAEPIKAPVGGSATQIVEFYNKYANEVKAADKITIQKHDKRDMEMDIPAMLRKLMPKDSGEFDPHKDETTKETFANGKGAKDSSRKLNEFLPVSGKAYVSKLKASHVQSASCAKQGEGWILKIDLKEEPLDIEAMRAQSENMSEAEREKMTEEWMEKLGYAACMDLGSSNSRGGERDQERSQRRSGNFDMSSMKMEGAYKNGVIVADIDKEGKLTALSLSYISNMNISVMGMKVKIDTTSKQEYQFTW